MEVNLVVVAAVIFSLICVITAIFQVLLALGYPLGEFALGGSYKILPHKLRVVSVCNALILLFMGLVVLQHAEVFTSFAFLSTNLLMWVITVFLGLNTLANLISPSKKERYVMTPISTAAFLLCLLIVLS
ncbi:hypothetical protein [Gracilibacillus massiliensis]|uniref:hypothetical protein n=1 Tax=Gracilibacillus massiliensis TaxID=1564956 RepID=UPI00071DFD8C|nr:hypothetical protein [Gracilibacillus massiliensis]